MNVIATGLAYISHSLWVHSADELELQDLRRLQVSDLSASEWQRADGSCHLTSISLVMCRCMISWRISLDDQSDTHQTPFLRRAVLLLL